MATNKIEMPMPIECATETIEDIFILLRQLFDIYSSEFKELLPNELLQLSHIHDLFNRVLVESTHNPLKLLAIQRDCSKDLIKMFNDFHLRITTFKDHEQLFHSFPYDKRFSNPIWNDNPYFELLKRLYYLLKKYSLRLLYALHEIDNKTRQQLHFYIVNSLNLFSPTNYVWHNPEVIKSIIESGGNNLLRGFKNYLEDLVFNEGKLNVRMTDTKAFSVGENLAISKGKVIFQNDLMQLIQYEPTTTNVYKTPILFVPPWINKYYVLDLSPKNSLVKWLVDQGYTVFMISWVNPDQGLAHKTFSDYMLDGPVKAIEVVTKQAQCPSVNMVGYCIGGTLLACALAYLEAQNDKRVKSATFFMSLVNFSNPGEIGVFIDKPQIDALDKVMEKKGYLNGRILEMTFNMLRPNELIWPYFINNYLLGNQSRPFDLLYWNSDSSNQPYKMYKYYLHNMYLKNLLRQPNALKLNNVPIDLGKIKTPLFFVSSETDHITLWRSVFSGVHLFSAPAEFILSESGHVRAVVNPPEDSNKYGFKANPAFDHASLFKVKSRDWLNGAKRYDGSWWPYWVKWLKKQDDTLVKARQIDDKSVLEDAPGSYVKKRI